MIIPYIHLSRPVVVRFFFIIKNMSIYFRDTGTSDKGPKLPISAHAVAAPDVRHWNTFI